MKEEFKMVHAELDATRTKLENSRIFDRQARTYDAEGWGRFTSPLLQRAHGALNLPPGESDMVQVIL